MTDKESSRTARIERFLETPMRGMYLRPCYRRSPTCWQCLVTVGFLVVGQKPIVLSSPHVYNTLNAALVFPSTDGLCSTIA
jgi:hypothetical protein